MIDIEAVYEDVVSFFEVHGHRIYSAPRVIISREDGYWIVTIVSDPYPNEWVGTLAPKNAPHETQTGLWYALEGPAFVRDAIDEALKALADSPRRRQYVRGQGATIQDAVAEAWAALKKEFAR